MSKSEQAKLDDAGRTIATSNERADELAEEGARDDSFQSILYDTYKAAVETSRAIINNIGNFILRVNGGERWPDVVAPPQGWDEKDERWKRAAPILASTQAMVQRRKNWLGQNAWGTLQRRWGSKQSPKCHLLAQTGNFV